MVRKKINMFYDGRFVLKFCDVVKIRPGIYYLSYGCYLNGMIWHCQSTVFMFIMQITFWHFVKHSAHSAENYFN
jgi:hypothetical protein